MSGRQTERALARLAAHAAVLAPEREGVSFAVFPNGDRRRRAAARVSAAEVKELAASGAIARIGDALEAYTITEAGRARLRRGQAAPSERFAAQHRTVIDRSLIDEAGDVRQVRGHDPHPALKRIAALRDANGAPWLSAAEIATANWLRADWERAQAGLVRGSDWAAPPRGSTSRGPGNAQEDALAARCDAGRRTYEALAALAPQLRRVVERVVLQEDGLEAIERAENWPPRCGKIALKLGLAQLAEKRG